ncbi:MAG: HAD hydrolase-like protein [Gemmatimonadota bacterium]
MTAARRHVLFDLDGTLTDPSEGIVACLEYALDTLGGAAADPGDLTRFIGPPLTGTFGTLLGTGDSRVIDAAITAYRERFAEVGLFENRLIEGIEGALVELEDHGVDLRVATAKPTVYADRIVDHFGLRPFFPVVYGSELDGRKTDKIDLLAHIFSEEGWQGTDACMVGDRRHDVVGAVAHESRAVGVLWGFGSDAELRDAGAHAVVSTPGDLAHAIVGAG